MTGSLYYEVTASGRRVALCVDKADAEEVARHWYDGQVRQLPPYVRIEGSEAVALDGTRYPIIVRHHGDLEQSEAKRKEEDTQP